MAVFLLKENVTRCVRATEIDIEGEYIVAWDDDKRVAIFRASEVIGCWIDYERKCIDGRVC